jgi:hypothetical protein
MLLETHPEQVGTLEVVASGIDRSITPSIVLKVAEGYRAYREMVIFGSVRILLAYLDGQGQKLPDFQKETNVWLANEPMHLESVSGPFRNMGGQLVSEPQIKRLIHRIEEGQVDSWKAIHDQYATWWEEYPRVKATVALQTLQKLLRTAQLDVVQWEYLIDRFLILCDQNALEVYRSRKKDFEDPFRKMVYRNEEEMDAVLGKPEDNSFIKQSRSDMEKLKELARRFSPWV